MDAGRMTLTPFDGLSGATLASVGAHLAAGIVAGVFYFRSLWWTARRVSLGGRVTATLAVMVCRLALIGGLLTLASLEGALPLLVMALGVLIARFAVMRRVREAIP
jgi:F1F0 ATPase subunit 2